MEEPITNPKTPVRADIFDVEEGKLELVRKFHASSSPQWSERPYPDPGQRPDHRVVLTPQFLDAWSDLMEMSSENDHDSAVVQAELWHLHGFTPQSAQALMKADVWSAVHAIKVLSFISFTGTSTNPPLNLDHIKSMGDRGLRFPVRLEDWNWYEGRLVRMLDAADSMDSSIFDMVFRYYSSHLRPTNMDEIIITAKAVGEVEGIDLSLKRKMVRMMNSLVMSNDNVELYREVVYRVVDTDRFDLLSRYFEAGLFRERVKGNDSILGGFDNNVPAEWMAAHVIEN